MRVFERGRRRHNAYAAMVIGLKELAEKEDFGVINLYTDDSFNAISDERRDLFMADVIHPTKVGYLNWWTPKIEECLNAFLLRAQ